MATFKGITLPNGETYLPEGGGGGTGGNWVKVGSVTTETLGEELTVSGLNGATRLKLVCKLATETDNSGYRIYFNEQTDKRLGVGSSCTTSFGYSVVEIEMFTISDANILVFKPFNIPKNGVLSTVNTMPASSMVYGVLIVDYDSIQSVSVGNTNGKIQIGSVLEVYKWQ